MESCEWFSQWLTRAVSVFRCNSSKLLHLEHFHLSPNDTKFSIFNSCYATWSEAYRLVRMPNAPELRLHDPLDPENLPKTDRRDVLARNWTKEWANLDKSPAKKRTIRFPVFPKQPWKHKCAPPKHRTESPSKGLLKPPKCKPREHLSRNATPKKSKSRTAKQATSRPLPTLQVPSKLPATLTPKQELLHNSSLASL